MTAIVGVLCKDGIVIGTDSSTTFGQGQCKTIEQPSEKLSIIDNHVIIAGTGPVGLGQRFGRIVQEAWVGNKFNGHYLDCGKYLAHAAIEDFASTKVERGQYGALVAFPVKKTPYLCEFALSDFQPEFKTEKIWYGSMGSTVTITDTFLGFIRDTFWQNGPPLLSEGILSAVWTLQLAIQINPGGVNGPMRIATMRTIKGDIEAKILTEEDLGETHQMLSEMKEKMRGIRDSHSPTESTNPLPSFVK